MMIFARLEAGWRNDDDDVREVCEWGGYVQGGTRR